MTTNNNLPGPYIPNPDAVLQIASPDDCPQGYSCWVEHGEWKAAPKVDSSKYYPHAYQGHETGIGNCICGCYMGSCSSRGNVNPFGACPLNPRPTMTAPEMPDGLPDMPRTTCCLNDQIHAALTAHGAPMAISGLIHHLTNGMKCDRVTLIQAILAIHECPGTWRIDIDSENGQAILGLDSQEKPKDPVAYLGLVPLDIGGGKSVLIPDKYAQPASGADAGTPRTEKECWDAPDNISHQMSQFVDADFARTLERELSQKEFELALAQKDWGKARRLERELAASEAKVKQLDFQDVREMVHANERGDLDSMVSTLEEFREWRNNQVLKASRQSIGLAIAEEQLATTRAAAEKMRVAITTALEHAEGKGWRSPDVVDLLKLALAAYEAGKEGM